MCVREKANQKRSIIFIRIDSNDKSFSAKHAHAQYVFSSIVHKIWPQRVPHFSLVHADNYYEEGEEVCHITFMDIADTGHGRTPPLPPPDVLEEIIAALKKEGIHDKPDWYHPVRCWKCGRN